MFYELNVTLNNAHFFATAERSLLDEDRALEVFRVLREKFPESAGYAVTASLCQRSGRNVTEALVDKIRVQDAARRVRKP